MKLGWTSWALVYQHVQARSLGESEAGSTIRDIILHISTMPKKLAAAFSNKDSEEPDVMRIQMVFSSGDGGNLLGQVYAILF